MEKVIEVIIAVSTWDNWKTLTKDVMFAEPSKEKAIETCKKFKKQFEQEEKIEGYDVKYIYQSIKLYD